MSRKHAPLPASDLQVTLGAIARRRDVLLAEGHALASLVVVLDPPHWAAVRPMWGASIVRFMLGMLAELDERADGWRIRVRDR